MGETCSERQLCGPAQEIKQECMDEGGGLFGMERGGSFTSTHNDWVDAQGKEAGLAPAGTTL